MEIPLHEEVRMLAGSIVLETLSEEELEELAQRCPDIHFRPGEIFSTPEEKDEKLFVLKQGRVQIYRLGPDEQQQTLTELEAGTALATERLHGSYVRAIEPTTVISISREEMKRLIGRNPEVGMRFIEVLARHLRQTDERLADVALKEVPARLASLLVQLVESEGIRTREGYVIPVNYTQERLAAMIGAARVSVSRAFTTLRKNGMIQRKDRHIFVKDIQALKQVAISERRGQSRS